MAATGGVAPTSGGGGDGYGKGDGGAASAPREDSGSSASELSCDDAGGDDSGTPAPPERVRTAGRVLTVRELWCAKAEAAYPSADCAGRLSMALLEECWGGRAELSGPAIEVRVQAREDRFLSLASGLVSVLRRPFEGWEVGSLEKIRSKAWQVQSSLEECTAVKAFGKVSNHAREINWLFTAVEKFLENGGALSKKFEEIKIGYVVLRPNVARDNGNEWQGATYGINLDLDELYAVVEWAGAMVADKKWAMNPELRVDKDKRRVVSTAVVSDATGFAFHSADHIMGSASILVEGALDVSDFDLGESNELPGLEILYSALDEKMIFDVEPSTRGLAVKGVVRVRIRCALRHEKTLRSKIKKLVRATAGVQKHKIFETSEGPIEVAFHSLHSLRRLEAAEPEGGGGTARGRLSMAEKEDQRRKDAMLEDLQAHQIRSAAALDRVISQVEKLAVHQEQLTVHHEQTQEHARQVHASLAAEQARALGTVNQLAGIFTSFMESARNGHVLLTNNSAPPQPAEGSRYEPRPVEAALEPRVALRAPPSHGRPLHAQLQLGSSGGRRDEERGAGELVRRGRRAGNVSVKEAEDADVHSPPVEGWGVLRSPSVGDGRKLGGQGAATLVKTKVNSQTGFDEGRGHLTLGVQGEGSFEVKAGEQGFVYVFSVSRSTLTGLSQHDPRLRRSIFEGPAFSRELRWIRSPGESCPRGREARGGGEARGSLQKRWCNAKAFWNQEEGRDGSCGDATQMASEAGSGRVKTGAISDGKGAGKRGDMAMVRRHWICEGDSCLADARESDPIFVGGGADADGGAKRRGGGRSSTCRRLAVMASPQTGLLEGRLKVLQEALQSTCGLGHLEERDRQLVGAAGMGCMQDCALCVVQGGCEDVGESTFARVCLLRGRQAALPSEGGTARSKADTWPHKELLLGGRATGRSVGGGRVEVTGLHELLRSATPAACPALLGRRTTGPSESGGAQISFQTTAGASSGAGTGWVGSSHVRRGVETLQSSYPDVESWLIAVAGELSAARRTSDCTAHSTRLGHIDGGAHRRAASRSKRFDGGLGSCGEKYHRPSTSLRCCSLLVEKVGGRRPFGWVTVSGWADVYLALIRHRHHGGCGRLCRRGTLEVRTGGRGQRHSGISPAGCVGWEASEGGSQRARRRRHSGRIGKARAGRYHDAQLAVRTVVHSKQPSSGRLGEAGATGTCIRGEPSSARAGRRSVAEGYHSGVCGRAAAIVCEEPVVPPAGYDRTPQSLELVETVDMPPAHTTWGDTTTTRLGDWSVALAEGEDGGAGCLGREARTAQTDGRLSSFREDDREGREAGNRTIAQAPRASRLRLRGGGPCATEDQVPLQTPQGSRDRTDDGETTAAGQTEARSVQGRGLFWNARQLCMPIESQKGGCREASKAAMSKLDFLEHQIMLHEPWFVALLEVSGDMGRMRLLRRWFRRRGLGQMVFLLGEGGSRGGPSAATAAGNASIANGIVFAARNGWTILSAKRLEFRTLAVQAIHKETQRKLCLTLVHGASVEGGEHTSVMGKDEGGSFALQLNAAMDWCSERFGAILMDANRVPCRRWRDPAGAALSRGDVALRLASGWRCVCCSGRGDSEVDKVASLIGDQLNTDGSPRWTRWGGSSTGGSPSRSRLDIGLTFKGGPVSWKQVQEVEPWLLDEGSQAGVSDHALLVYTIDIADRCIKGEARPLPVQLGPRPRADQAGDLKSAWVQLAHISGRESFIRKFQRAGDQADDMRQSRVQALVPLLRAAGERAVQLAKIAEESERQVARMRRGFEDSSELHSWRQRLKVALMCARGQIRCGLKEWKLLFHHRSGMRRHCRKFDAEHVSSIAWHLVVTRCRRQIARAQWYLEKRRSGEDEWLADKCRQIEEQTAEGDKAAHINTIWRLIGKRGGAAVKVNELHRGDKKDAPVLGVDDPEFLLEAGRIGEAFVQEMDRGALPSAFAAWLEVVCTRFDTVAGARGSWSLREDFTYEVFERTLQAMRGKAVGAGGLSVEVLMAVVPEIRWAFYQAITSDVDLGRIAPSWHRVIYVLLRKPPPNDPALVSQRREIALMPQDLKVLLQGVRQSSYSKVCARLDEAQYGWRKGVGCADPSLAVACVLDQARRLQHPVWMLYIDLANFFPAINRVIACACELFLGLPEEVTRILGRIYGGQQGEPAHASCQYETGAGLGAPFTNGVGRLMGCPISPDSAKILLNSVLLAIKQAVSGVQLWPFEGDSICQLAYADDWVGLFDDVAQLRRALLIWLTWAEVVGARLGIKGLIKTVVSGVVYTQGKARTPADPRLCDLEGKTIPLLPCDELYKHLGIPRAASADGYKTWTGSGGVCGVRDKIRASISRLRKLRASRTSPEQFICISNVLMGGLGGFYLQSTAASEEELEQLEREWRRCFNRFARRDPTSHALPLYTTSTMWRKGRSHLARIGWAALFSAVSKLLADVSESPARAAVRSAIALSFHHWGCRSDPNRWCWAHLRDPLRTASRRHGARFVGDAWMLACLFLEDGCVPEKSREHRAEQLRVRKHGRWMGWGETLNDGGGPLRALATWHQRVSRPLFEPRESGGLGLEPQSTLLSWGISELNQLCTHPFLADGLEGRWLTDKREAEQRIAGTITAAGWKQWLSVVEALKRRGVRPVKPETRIAAARRTYQAARLKRKGCSNMELAALARSYRRQRLGLVHQWSAAENRARLESVFPRSAGSEPVTDGAAGCSSLTWIGHRLEGVESELVEQWGRFPTRDLPATTVDNWALEADRLRSLVCFRKGDGWPLWGSSAEECREEALDTLPAPLQLAVRARLQLGREASVIAEGFGEKLEGIRVAEDVQQGNWECLCHLHARFEFTHALATDASEGEIPFEAGADNFDEWGWPRRRTAAVAVSHAGGTRGGCVPDDESSDSYVGEMLALIAALDGAPAGSRLLIILDSTSPVKAWLRFRRRDERTRRQYKACVRLEALERAVRRHDLVYFLWQRSHCGSPVNEWADKEAERMRLQGEPELVELQEQQGLFALWPARCQGSLFRWAVRAGEKAAHAQMVARCANEACCPQEDDWDLGGFQGPLGVAASALRDDRMMMADAGHILGARERQKAGDNGCCLGCGGQRGTWYHYAFYCTHPKLWEQRTAWKVWILENRRVFDQLYLHKQVDGLVGRLCGSERGATGDLRVRDADLPGVRRLMAGLITKEEAGFTSQSAAKAAIREMVCGGLRLLCLAAKLEGPRRREVELEVSGNNLLRRVLRGWRKHVDLSGPFRVAALRQIRHIRWALVEVGETRCGEGTMSKQLRNRLMHTTLQALAAARAEIEEGCSQVGEEAIILWYLQLRWWGRWANTETLLEGRQWEAWAPSAADAMRAISRWARGIFQLDLQWGGGNEEPLRWFGDRQRLDCRFSLAYRAFLRLGGVRRLRVILRRVARDKAELGRRLLGERMNKFLQHGTCSGGPRIVIPAEQRLEVVIEPRTRKRRRTREAEKAWAQGTVADKRGRWAVELVTEVRRRQGGVKGWEAKVTWAGPFEDSWVGLRDLSADLQVKAWELIESAWDAETDGPFSRARGPGSEGRSTRVRGSQARERPKGVRKSPRLVEAEAKRDKLRTALVVYLPRTSPTPPGDREEPHGCNIKKAWGVHLRGSVRHVYVERWARGEWRAAVIPLARLPDVILNRVERAGRYVASQDGASSSMNVD